ncbi:MAG: hypothetical protein DDT33_01440 [Firmicutes bacterium]|nr:hypothetical protein [Bacillota bacterium]
MSIGDRRAGQCVGNCDVVVGQGGRGVEGRSDRLLGMGALRREVGVWFPCSPYCCCRCQ